MTGSSDRISPATANRARELLADCIDEAEALHDAAVERLCRDHPALAARIQERLDEVRAAGLVRPPEHDSWKTDPTRLGEATAKFEPIGPYQPLAELGRGGQGVVYLAEDLRLHRVVALKILRGFGPLSEKMMQRFKREAEVASKLDHPGICAVYDAGMLEGIPYIAMRYVKGTTIAAKIREARTLAPAEPTIATFLEPSGATANEDRPVEVPAPVSTAATERSEILKVVAIFEKAARAIHVAHEAGIVHRDVKPGNIMVTPAADPVWLDFGLATEEAQELSLTQTGDLFGTPAYMSPEQLMAQRIRLDRRTDVYSLAVTLFECVTLRRPFEAPTREGMYQAIQYKPAPDPRKLNPGIPVDLKVVLHKALEKDRDRRYETALDFAEDLRRVCENEPILARPVSTPGRVLRWAKRRPFRAALVGALLILVPLATGLASYAIAKQPEIRSARESALLAEVERHLMRGCDELAEGSPAAAIEAFDAALAHKPDAAEAIGGKALALLATEQHQPCLDLLGRHPNLPLPVLHRLRADALRGLGRTDEAAGLVKDQGEPGSAVGFFLAGAHLMRDCSTRGDKEVFRRAAGLFEQATLTAPHARPLYHGQLAHALGHLHEEDPCRRVAQALVERWPDSPSANGWAGWALRGVDPGQAVRVLRRAIALDPSFAFAWDTLGSSLLKDGRPREAIAAHRKAVALRPDEPAHYLMLGHALRKMGRLEEAVGAYRKAMAVDSRHAPAHVSLGDLLGDDRADHEGAIRAFREAIRLNPGYLEAHFRLGVALRKRGRLSEAIAAFAKAAEVGPGDSSAHANLGECLTMVGRLDEAIAAGTRVAAANPEDAFAHHVLGRALLLARRPREARNAYRKAVALDPGNPVFRNDLGVALKRMGDLGGAVQQWRAAIDGKPDEATRKAAASNLRECERMVTLRPRYERLLRGGAEPSDAAEAVLMAWLARTEVRYGTAAGLYAFALQKDLTLVDETRYDAACYAALASAGKGNDAANFGPADRAGWARQATARLNELLAGCEKALEEGTLSRAELRERLLYWKADPALAGIRDRERIRKLPPGERTAVGSLWKAVDGLLERVTR